jgi:chemotaxis protein CheD
MNERPTNFTPQLVDRRQPGDSTYDYFHSKKRVLDKESGLFIIKIFAGDFYVSRRSGEMLSTILGSCISACIRDPQLRIGGMNHFLLPGDEHTIVDEGAAARYGLFAMESLINGILKAGGDKTRLEVKIFGGGNVTNNSARIGSKNAAFVRKFLTDEGFRIAAQDVEGELPRRIHYFPDTGKVMMRKLRRADDLVVVEEEKAYQQKIAIKPTEGDVDLF